MKDLHLIPISKLVTSKTLMNPSKPTRILIVGGVAGGASAATRARRMNADAEITIFEKGPAVSFANCGLPYHLGGEIEKREKLIVASKALFWNRFRIRVETDQEVTRIDRSSRTIEVVNASTSELVTHEFDRLILSTGSTPNVPDYCNPMPANAFHLWTLSDMDRVLALIAKGGTRRAVVVGAGFVGLEVVEQLHRLGISVDLIERNPQVLTRLDRIFARMIERHMESKQIRLHLGRSIRTLELDGTTAKAAILDNGTKVDTDLLIIGAGVRPRVQLASDAGLALGNSGGVLVNEFMQTNDPQIYAVGDMIEYVNGVTGQRSLNALAGPANRSGRIAGEHAAIGTSRPMAAVLGTSIVRVFDLTAGCTGLNEKLLASAGIRFNTSIIQAPHHASYFPGAQSLQLKLLYAPDSGKILGAQCVGGDGVDKRIDVIATAMQFGGTVWDLANLDLAYAPPFGSAKDPIHMAAFTACNDLQSHPKLLPPDADLTGMQIVDVRTATERAALPLADAIPLEIDAFPDGIEALDPNRPTVVVCHSGKRAHIGACWLQTKGFRQVANLTGGMSIRSLAPTTPKNNT